MVQLHGKNAQTFIAWLAIATKFLPRSMSIEEASEIFMRYTADEENHEKKGS